MKPSALAEVLPYFFEARKPVLLVGPPGIGKTDIPTTAAEKSGYDLILSHPAVGDPTDAKGLPWVAQDHKRATFLPFGEMERAIHATRPTVWFLDDLGQAPGAVQASYMQLLLARRVNDHVLPDCVTFVAATNRRQDKAGVQGILEPVKSRFASILHVEVDIDDWTRWAFDAGMPVELISFLRFRHTTGEPMLLQFNPSLDMVNSPCPRSWANVGRMMLAGLPQRYEREVFAGAVGEAAAGEFVAFLKMAREIPNPDAVILDPDGAVIPKDMSVKYALVVALAARTNKTTFRGIARYAERLVEAGLGEFAALLLRDSLRKCPEVQTTDTFMRLAVGEIGKLFLE